MRGSRWAGWAAALLLLVMIVEIVLSTRQASLSWDEGDHIFSGYMNWKRREYSLNPEHPPLVKLIAALPLLALDLKIAPRQGRYFKDEAYYGGRELLFRNDPRYGGKYTADSLIFRAHMAVMVFALLLGTLLFLAGCEMFGPTAGLITLTLFVFDPTILTNAPFVTTDSAAACFFFASVYAFYRYTKAPSWQRLLTCGIATGLALVSKHSTILLLPVLILLAAGEVAGQWYGTRATNGVSLEDEARPKRFAAQLALAMLGMSAIALFLLWGFYSFRYAMHPTGVAMPSLAERANGLSAIPAKVILGCARFHLLPESYLYGLVDVQRVGNFMPSYIFGKLHAHGVWFYFPVALSIKWSVGVLGLLAVALYAFITGRTSGPAWTQKPREIFFLTLPALFYLGFAITGPLNIGVRHVLPVFPFAFALAGGGAAVLIRRRRAWQYPVAALLLWHCIDSVRMFPNYLPYANTLWGGPAKTHLYLTDSATDWAQELKSTKRYIDQHNIHDCWFAYFAAPFLLPSDYGIPCKLLPTFDDRDTGTPIPAVLHGPVLISYADLNGFEFGTKVRNPYQDFFERTPDDTIANGIAVFNGDFSASRLVSFQSSERSKDLLAKDPQGSFKAAIAALQLDPANLSGQFAAGDALHALRRDPEAREHYMRALDLVNTMEPSAQQQWRPRVEGMLHKLSN